jgi:chromosome segregation ATPase
VQAENSKLEARLKQGHVQNQLTNSLNEQIVDVNAQLASVKQRLTNSQASLATKSEEIARLTALTEEKEAKINAQKEASSSNIAKLSEVRVQHRKVKEPLDDTVKDIKILEKSKAKLRTEKHGLSFKLQRKLDIILDLEHQLEDYRGKHEELVAEK